MALENGEFVHVVEHRRFESDVRRHFVGKVVSCQGSVLRLEGYLFTFNLNSGRFERVSGIRERIFSIDNRISFTLLSPNCDLDNLMYQSGEAGLYLTDDNEVNLDVGVFAKHG